MKVSFSSVHRLCLIGLLLECLLSLAGSPRWFAALGCVPFLWGTMHLRSLHDGFSSAFWISVVRLLLIGAGAIPTLRMFLWESVWSCLIPLCLWVALACLADGFWHLRLSRGLSRNRSAAATVCLQILLDADALHAVVWLIPTIGILYITALWYDHRAALELDACEDPPRIS